MRLQRFDCIISGEKPGGVEALQQCWRRTSVTGTLFAALLLNACSGGDPRPTPLPERVSIQAPAQVEPDAAVAFDASLDKDAAGLSRRWSFGDGQTSTEAAPRHRYAQPGRYEVVLDIVNEAGNTRSARAEVLVGRFSIVEGLGCSGAQSTGWCLQWPQEARYNELLIQNATIGWSVGQDGQLYRTDEADATWRRVDMGLPLRRLYDLKFADDQTGWALGVADDPPNHIGSRGVLLAKTTDGGRTWKRHTLPEGWTPADVETANLQVLDRQRVLARTSGTTRNLVSSDGGVRWDLAKYKDMLFATTGTAAWVHTFNVAIARGFLRSTDLGVSVDESAAFMYPPTGVVNNLQFVDDQYGWATLETRSPSGYPSDAIYTTTNGGSTWSLLRPPSQRHPLQLSAPTLTMIDRQRGYWTYSWTTLGLGGGTVVSSTTDGGITWGNGFFSGRQDCSNFGFMAGAGIWKTAGGCGNEDPGNGFIELLGSDFGTEWRRVPVPLNVREHGLRSVQPDADQRLLLRYTTQTYRSSDEGTSWQIVKRWPTAAPLPSSDSRNSIAFQSGTVGAAMVAGSTSLVTDNGGKTWRPWATTSPLGFLSGTRAERRGRWQFIGDESWQLAASLSNAGAIDAPWTSARYSLPAPTSAAPTLRDMHFIDAQQGFAVGPNSVGGSTVVSTANGGKTPWRSDQIDGLKAMALRFADGQRGLVVGEAGAIALTTDGGRTWTRRTSGSPHNLHAVHYATPDIAWAVGARGTVLVSSDGGSTWKPAALDSPFDWQRVHFADARHGWIVGDFGSVAHTRDGGQTWQMQRSATAEHLVDVFALDAGTAWVVSDRGLIFATASGGH